jgi:GDP-D-mannose dehydratase
VAKLCFDWITVNCRHAIGFCASSGILCNHERTPWSETFVARNIAMPSYAFSLGFEIV